MKSNLSLDSLTFSVLTHSHATKYSEGVVCGISSSDTVEIRYSLDFLKTFEDVKESRTIKCLQLKILSESSEKLLLSFSHESILILEPDLIISVSEVVQSVVDNEINTNLLYFDSFTKISLSSSIIVGSLANAIFDELLIDSQKAYTDIFEQFLRSKPLIPALLQTSYNSETSESLLDMLFSKGVELYDSLSHKIQFLPKDTFTLEPQFVSNNYSIVGRLDYMYTHIDTPIIEVIELKSSKAPSFSGNFYFRSIKFPSTMWSSHFIQVVCYQLLLESVYPDKGIRHSMLYASENENFLRSVPITTVYKRVCLEVRNKIVSSKMEILSKKFSFHSSLINKELGIIPTYSQKTYNLIQEKYSTCSELLLLYFRSMVYFLENESYTSTLSVGNGNRTSNSRSLFFFLSEEEKRKSLYFFDNLSLLHWHDGVIRFEINSDRETSLRSGDSVLVYPQTYRPESLPLLKTTIVSISQNEIVLKQQFQLSNSLFTSFYASNWCIEIDSTQRSVSIMYTKMLSNILWVTQEKQSILLGVTKPRIQDNSVVTISKEGKTKSQIEAIEGALASKDYFLIQGPPGTGKTSVVLKEIVKNIIENTSENIVIIAYTNKVVDELCMVMIQLGFQEILVRLGSTQNEIVKPYLVSSLISSISLEQISKELLHKRICISTVASIVANPEIFLLWKFQTAIFDEAAQIVEAYCIGIASFCERSIFIGDEKQLPAIVVQNKQDTIINSKDLHSIGLYDLSESLFSRLLHNAKQNNWTHCTAMLKEQGRMHIDIQQLANTLYYQQQLTPLRSLQTSNQQLFENSTILEAYFQHSRAIFCDIQPENSSIEEEILKLLDTMIEEFTTYAQSLRIGIITPFRKFNHTVLQHFSSKNVENIDVDTVERFQGSERDVIFYCVPLLNSEQLKTIQTISELDGVPVDRKLNVAITRAKEYFILIGSSTVLQNCEQYSRLIDLLPKI